MVEVARMLVSYAAVMLASLKVDLSLRPNNNSRNKRLGTCLVTEKMASPLETMTAKGSGLRTGPWRTLEHPGHPHGPARSPLDGEAERCHGLTKLSKLVSQSCLAPGPA